MKIGIKHTKPIKSLHGIIVTLVRQGRFDTFPISANGLSNKGSAGSLKKGLSLTSGGTTTTFRKDLSQVIMPLIVDPNTLTTVVRASVRVPEDAFPTISSVPGQIVSFRYFIEVLVDLGGKLAGKEEFLNGVGMVNIPNATTGELGRVEANLGKGDASGMMAVYGAKVIETDKIRREVKNVVSCRFEVIVGTTDSANGKGRQRKADGANYINLTTQDTDVALDLVGERRMSHPEYDDEHMRTIIIPGNIVDNLLDNSVPHSPPSPPVPISLPTVSAFPDDRRTSTPPPPPDFSHLDEKTRLRMAEQALLPSAPPGFDDAGASSSSAVVAAPSTAAPAYMSQPPLPSAPPLAMVDEEYMAQQATQHAPSAPPVVIDMNMDAARYFGGHQNHNDHHYPHHYHTPQQSTTSPASVNEDKLEMERLRLLAAASAPPLPESSSSVSGHASTGRVGSSTIPSAPELGEDGDGDLPRYER